MFDPAHRARFLFASQLPRPVAQPGDQVKGRRGKRLWLNLIPDSLWEHEAFAKSGIKFHSIKRDLP